MDYSHVIIVGRPSISPASSIVMNDREPSSFVCMATSTGPDPNVTWTIISDGVEADIACGYQGYQITTNLSQADDGILTVHSTLNIASMEEEYDSTVVVRCKLSGFPETAVDAYLLKTGTLTCNYPCTMCHGMEIFT